MRVLVLYEYLKPERGNYRLIGGFMKQMRPLCDSFSEVLLSDLRKKIQKGYTCIDLQKDYKPNVIICYGNFATEVFNGYFTKMPCAKTVVITDFHGHTNNNQGIMKKYAENGFDIMFMRGVYDKKYKSTIPMIWLPFSANEKEFYPDNSIRRQNIIGFAGMVTPSVYVVRRNAIKLLKKAKLLKVCDKNTCNKGDKKKNVGYPLFLRSVSSCLTSTDLYDWPPTPRAKTFEIMGSKTVLLTPPFEQVEKMIGKSGRDYVGFKMNCSDIIKQARKIVNEPIWARTIAKNGYKIFLEKHTDRIRIKEFYRHLQRLVSGKSIERPWNL
jgi:hypothetical protein